MNHRPADVVLRGGRITTLSSSESTPDEATALAIIGERVAWAGDDDAVGSWIGPATMVVDLEGRRVVPGLIDAHVHFVRAGFTWLDEIRWGTVDSLAEGYDLIAEEVRSKPAGEWIRVIGGWHPTQFVENRHPTKAELDELAPDHPVIVQFLYEWAIVNQAALERIDWDSAADWNVDPETLEKDADGNVTGRVSTMPSLRWLQAQLPLPDLERQVESTRAASREFSSFGITGLIDGGGSNTGPDRYDAVYESWRRGELSVRVRTTVHPSDPGTEEEQIGGFLRYSHARQGDRMLQVLAIGENILFAVGDSFARLPDLSEKQLDRCRAIFEACAAKRWTVQMHMIRPEKTAAMLDLWREVHEKHDISDLRWAIVHGTSLTEDDIPTLKELGIGVLPEALLRLEGDEVTGYWGEERLRAAPPVKAFREAGVPVAVGSDAMRVASHNPFTVLQWLVTGQTLSGRQVWDPQRTLDRRSALECISASATWFSFEEHDRGRLEPGHLADLAVLTADLFEVDEADIPAIRSDMTMVGGRVVWVSQGFESSAGVGVA